MKKQPLAGKSALTDVDCVSFYLDKGGHPKCSALKKVYCLQEAKPCPFQLTQADTNTTRMRSQINRICQGRP